ncbi:hypothetical protein GUJ93_ZPchr0010g8646 [Zizania palustris]|uniref:Uncharacterized protein n=1 Tax=Zizania palustris TaxID=103762 RepID=A0A8J5W737_ZIZPA|nr:hypothetical protein GUJ93_ZPchr0010g8646 [Zizania palustris]
MGSCSGPSVATCPDLLSGAQIYSRVLARVLLTARRSAAALAWQPPRYQALAAALAPKPQRHGEMGCGTRERERGGGRRRLAALSSTDSSLGAGELGHTGVYLSELNVGFKSEIVLRLFEVDFDTVFENIFITSALRLTVISELVLFSIWFL